jgi:antitoxin component YwqK of YwqJK toxin-antitoxin module
MVSIGYKKCMPIGKHGVRLIGVFEITEDAIICPKKTNDFARYRVNKCMLIRVEDLNGNIINDIDTVLGVSFISLDPPLIFEKNKLVELPEFVENEKKCDMGILMFFSKQRAQFYLLEYLTNGMLKTWRDDGNIYSIENFFNEKKHGLCTYYHSNGQIKEESEYGYGSIINLQTFYDINGKITKQYNYCRNINLFDSKYT